MLSSKAIKDLKVAIDHSYGEGFSRNFNDTEIDEIGMFLLTAVAERAKMYANEEKGVDLKTSVQS